MATLLNAFCLNPLLPKGDCICVYPCKNAHKRDEKTSLLSFMSLEKDNLFCYPQHYLVLPKKKEQIILERSARLIPGRGALGDGGDW